MTESERRVKEIWDTELTNEQAEEAALQGIYMAKRKIWQLKQNGENTSFKAGTIDFKPESKGEENKSEKT